MADRCKITDGMSDDLLVNLVDGCYMSIDKKVTALFDEQYYIEVGEDAMLINTIDLLVAKNLGTLRDERVEATEATPYLSPFLVSNAIISFGTAHNFNIALQEVLTLNCPYFEFRVASNEQARQALEVIAALSGKYYAFHYCVVFLKYEVPEQSFLKNRYFKFVDVPDVNSESARQPIAENTTITERNLAINSIAYAEAQAYNLGLNGKVYINENLEVFCHPGHAVSFGSLKAKRLSEIVPEMQHQQWAVTKDEIEDCRRCKFRYVCCDFEEVLLRDGKRHRKNACDFGEPASLLPAAEQP